MNEFLQFLLAGLVIGSIYGLVGIGYTVIYNVTGIVNFAQGEFAMLGAFLASLMVERSLPLPAAAILSICIVALIAAGIERFAIRPAGGNVLLAIIITIGVGIVIQGIVVAIWGTDARSVPNFSSIDSLQLGGVTVPSQSLWVLGMSCMLMVLLAWFFNSTYLGKAFRACAVNPSAARLVGIETRSMSVVAFVISGALGAIAGLLVAPISLVQYDTGIPLGIKGFVACIIGGLGRPGGAMLGGLVLGVSEAFASGYLSSGYKNAIAFVLLLLFLRLRPSGLLGDLERSGR